LCIQHVNAYLKPYPGSVLPPGRRPRAVVWTARRTAEFRQCLDRRVSDLDTLNTELAAWQHAINAGRRRVRRQFTADDARVKLRHPYRKSQPRQSTGWSP
jgi:hypothetical protein